MTARRSSSALVAALGVLALCSLLGASSLGAPARDRVAESAVSQLTQALDGALTGAHVFDREQLTRLVRTAYPTVVQSKMGANLRYATYQGRAQRLGGDVPVALAVWERSTGADPFTDDIPRWHLYCAQLHVDRDAASLQTTLVRCPRGVPESPDVDSERLPTAPALDHEAPDEGSLLAGTPAGGGSPSGLLRPAATAPTPPPPCREDELAVALELLTTAGATDDAALRVVNTSSSHCVVRGPTRLVVQGSDGRQSTGRAEQRDVTLAPRESVIGAVSWRPSQQAGPDAPRITLTLPAGDLPVRLGTVPDASPVAADPGDTLQVGAWQTPGYGVPARDQGWATIDVAAPCPREDLAAQTRQEPEGSGVTPSPQAVSVINLGIAPCRFGRGDLPAFQDLTGLPGFAPTPVTVLRPGESVMAQVTSVVEHRSGQLLVAGQWMRVLGE